MLSKESLFVGLGAKTKAKASPLPLLPPKHLKGLEKKYLWKRRLPIEESDQLLLVRNVGSDADGCLCKASRNLAASLRFPHHVGAAGEETSS
jgi:hypothetical protein